jgi:hypothetical protein
MATIRELCEEFGVDLALFQKHTMFAIHVWFKADETLDTYDESYLRRVLTIMKGLEDV